MSAFDPQQRVYEGDFRNHHAVLTAHERASAVCRKLSPEHVECQDARHIASVMSYANKCYYKWQPGCEERLSPDSINTITGCENNLYDDSPEFKYHMCPKRQTVNPEVIQLESQINHLKKSLSSNDNCEVSRNIWFDIGYLLLFTFIVYIIVKKTKCG